jgi:hypothetical protein
MKGLERGKKRPGCSVIYLLPSFSEVFFSANPFRDATPEVSASEALFASLSRIGDYSREFGDPLSPLRVNLTLCGNPSTLIRFRMWDLCRACA